MLAELAEYAFSLIQAGQHNLRLGMKPWTNDSCVGSALTQLNHLFAKNRVAFEAHKIGTHHFAAMAVDTVPPENTMEELNLRAVVGSKTRPEALICRDAGEIDFWVSAQAVISVSSILEKAAQEKLDHESVSTLAARLTQCSKFLTNHDPKDKTKSTIEAMLDSMKRL